MEAQAAQELSQLKYSLIQRIVEMNSPEELKEMEYALGLLQAKKSGLTEEEFNGLMLAVEQSERGELLPDSEVRPRIKAKYGLK